MVFFYILMVTNSFNVNFNVFIEKGISVTPGDRLKRGSNYHEITFVQPLLDRYGVECYKMLQTFVAK